MKSCLILLALFVAATYADVSELPSQQYLPVPLEEAEQMPQMDEHMMEMQMDGQMMEMQMMQSPQQAEMMAMDEAPIMQEMEPLPAHELAEDGYRYKTVRRLKYRN